MLPFLNTSLFAQGGVTRDAPLTCVKLMVKMACERLLTSFMPVLAVVRLMFPASISSSTSL